MERTPKDICSQAQVERIVKAALQVIRDAVANGEIVHLVGFGTFKAVQRGGRDVVRPDTGERITVPAKIVPQFRPKQAFREQCLKGEAFQGR